MKLSSLFAKYLYQQKQLRLPGIGVFSLDPSIVVPDISDKLFADFLQNIRFSQQTVSAPDEEFINFIRAETGKIKPLAESDLDSFVSDGKILLNIGKRFHLEGIGSLLKTREGVLEFKAGEPHLLKQEGMHEEEPIQKAKSFYLDTNTSTKSRKLLIALGAIAGFVIIIWGGYKLYNRNSPSSEANAPVTVLPSDTMAITAMPDSFQRAAADTVQLRPTYKFIIERTTSKARALRRYSQLTENRTAIKMDTQDSTLFNLYFILPASAADTARIRDSLKAWYARRVVYVE